MGTSKFENLLSPFKIGAVTVRNRFGMGPMGVPQAYGDKGVINDAAIDFFVERAAGGFGFIVMGAQQADDEVDPGIDASPLGFKYHPSLFRKQMLKLNERVAAFGTKMFPQISAGLGRNYPGFRAPSAVECYAYTDKTGIEMTKEEIKKKIDAVVNLAKVEKNAGMAGVEIHAMHWGYLLDQFAMSIMNKRQDEYGGSLENRLRMAKEIVVGIKQECGQDFPVMMRLGIKSYIKGLNKASFDGSEEAGRTLEEGVEICRLLEQYGYDALDLDTGIYDSFYYACPPSYIEQGYALDLYAQAKAAVKIPIIAGSRMQDPFMAEKAIVDGKIDGILLSRPAMADSFLPAKVQMGRPEKIRPCIACCQCFARSMDDDQFLTCAVNTVANKESTGRLKKALVPKRVVVVGGGVGGLEAARDAKLCGHDVAVYEKANVLGGLLNPAGAMSIKREMTQLLEWYELELKELGVSVYLNTAMDAEKVKALNPEVVIFATGSTPMRMEFIKGIESGKVYDCATGLLNQRTLGQRVAVIGGGNVGCEVAIELKTVGNREVILIERMEELLPNSGGTEASAVRMCVNDMVEHHDIEARTGCSLQEVTKDGIIVKKTNGETEAIDVDSVVLSVGFKITPTFARELYGSGIEVYEITGGGAGIPNVFRATQEAYEIVSHLQDAY